MSYRATYFDGKTSYPHEVYLRIKKNELEVSKTVDFEEITDVWNVPECKVKSFNAKSNLLITRGDFPGESLQVDGPRADTLHVLLDSNFNNNKRIFDLALRGNHYLVIFIGLIFLSILVNLYLSYVSPFVGDQIVKVIPKTAEMGIGESIISNYSEYFDINEERSETLQAFYASLGYTSEYDINVHYSNVELINAFATPGGQIVVFEGIIDMCDTWEELAALLGHELAHVNERHSFKLLTRNLGNYVIFNAITGDMAGLTSTILEGAYQLHELSNSRSFEREADIEGLKMMVASGINPSAAVAVFKQLSSYREMGYTDILQTHPLTSKRVKYLERIIKRNKLGNMKSKPNKKAEELFLELKKLLEQDLAEEDVEIEE
jgi:predicted Zn-dependent protease